jgi:Sec-independent protein translocase protein TatA
MNIFGIGPLELIFILLLALLIFGPRDLEKAGKTLAQTLLKIIRSDTWRTVSQASRKLKTLPNELLREAGIDELKQTIAPLDKDLQNIDLSIRKQADGRSSESWKAGSGTVEKESSTSTQAEDKPAPAETPGKPS